MPMTDDDPKRELLVTSQMTREVECVEPTTPIAHIRELFAEHALHHLPVVQGERLVGLISVTDVLRLGIDPDRREQVGIELRARHVMLDRGSVITAGENTTLREAAAILSDGYFHALPVVDADDRLLGIVTSTDLITFLADVLDPERASNAGRQADA